jgi:hypothetical protein
MNEKNHPDERQERARDALMANADGSTGGEIRSRDILVADDNGGRKE